MTKRPTPLEFCFYRLLIWIGIYLIITGALVFILPGLLDINKVNEVLNRFGIYIKIGIMVLSGLLIVVFDRDFLIKIKSNENSYKVYAILGVIFIIYLLII